MLVERRARPCLLVLVRRGRERAQERAVPARRRMEIEEPGPAVGRERVRHARGHDDHRARAGEGLVARDDQPERSVEHEEDLRVLGMGMLRRHRSPAREARGRDRDTGVVDQELDGRVASGDERLGRLGARCHRGRA